MQKTTPGDSLETSKLSPTMLVGIVAVAFVIAFVAALPVGGANVTMILLLTGILAVVATYVISRRVEGHRYALDRIITGLVAASFVVATIPLLSLVWTTVRRGLAGLDLAFLTGNMRNVVGEGGGISQAIIGTLIITGIAAVISVPIGILVAIYLVEYGQGQRLAKGISWLVDVMTGIPSIVTGLFALGLFTVFFGPGYRSGFAGSIALSVLMIPVVVRTVEEMLRLVPMRLREASYGLGVPRWRTIVKIVLPTALPGMVTGVILAVARVVGETAPLLLATGLSDEVNLNPFDGRMASLPLFIYNSYITPGIQVQAAYDRGWSAALVLLVLVGLLFGLARVLSAALTPKGLK